MGQLHKRKTTRKLSSFLIFLLLLLSACHSQNQEIEFALSYEEEIKNYYRAVDSVIALKEYENVKDFFDNLHKRSYAYGIYSFIRNERFESFKNDFVGTVERKKERSFCT